MAETTPTQRLHLVMGGRVKDPRGIEFQDPESIHVVGVFSSYDAAVDAWRAQAQRTVDDAEMKYVVVHIHKLLTPRNNSAVAAIRSYRHSDAGAVAALTLAAIRETALRAYSPAQTEAWAARYSVQRLLDGAAKGDVILVAVDDADHPLAYTVLEEGGHLDMLYCHPAHTGKGLGLALLAAAETAARAQGVTRLFTEASELARPVFTRAGYAVVHRRDFTIASAAGEVAIHNYAMEKHLG